MLDKAEDIQRSDFNILKELRKGVCQCRSKDLLSVVDYMHGETEKERNNKYSHYYCICTNEGNNGS